MSSSESIATPSRPTSPSGLGVIRVVAHQRGHVERGREPRLPVLEQVAEADVRLLGRAEAGELPHRPEPPAVHRRVDAAREREGAWVPEIAPVVEVDVVGRVERVDRQPGNGREERVALGGCLVAIPAPLLRVVEARTVPGRGHARRILRGRARLLRPLSSSGRALGCRLAARGRPHPLGGSRPLHLIFIPECDPVPTPPADVVEHERRSRPRKNGTYSPPAAHGDRLGRCRAGRRPARLLPGAGGGRDRGHGRRLSRGRRARRQRRARHRSAVLPPGCARPGEGRGAARADASDRRRRPHPPGRLHDLPPGRVGLGRVRGRRRHRLAATRPRGHARDGLRRRDDRRQRSRDGGVPDGD